MRYFQPPADTQFYAGVDLPAAPEPFRKAIAPFRDRLVVGCERMHCWYWLADTCRQDNIPFQGRMALPT